MAIIEPKGLKGLDRLKGYSSLSEEERDAFVKQQLNAGTLPKNYTYDQADRLYRNKRFIEEFGVDTYKDAVSKGLDGAARDKVFREQIINETAKDYYGNDKGFGYLSQTLTTDGWEDLMKSGYLNDADRDAKKNEIFKNKTADEIKDFMEPDNTLDYIFNSKTRSVIAEHQREIDKDQEDIKNKVISADDKRVKKSVKNDVDQLQKHFNVMANNISKAQEIQSEVMDNKKSVDELIDFMAESGIISNSTRKALYGMRTKDGSPDVVGKLNATGEILEKSVYNPAKYEDLYNSIALPSEVEGTDEFGNPKKVKLPGSNTYKALRGSSKLENFGPSDMLREYLTYTAIANKQGMAKAASVLDLDMQHIVDENETPLDWTEDVLLNIGIGGLANIMNKVNGINNLLVYTVYGKEGLSNKLQGKNPDGTERESVDYTPYIDAMYGDSKIGQWMTNLYKNHTSQGALQWFYDNAFNPQYWEKADHYNTLDPEMMKKIDESGGVSPFVNMHPVDEPLEFWSTRTLAEALKMMKFVWSDMLVAEATGGIASVTGATLGKAAGLVADIGTVLTSGVGIAESYAKSTYDQVYQDALENSREARYERALYEVNNDITKNGISEEDNKIIDNIVKERLKDQERRQASQEFLIGLSEEEIRKQVIEEYKNSMADRWLENHKDLEAQDEAAARRAAVNAYMVNATIEEGRMSVVNGAFRTFLFDKGTQNRLGLNREYAKTIINNEGKQSLVNKALYKAYGPAKLLFSGFESNYFDDVTVGFAKGFALGQDNDYLAKKYSPENEGKATDLAFSFIPGWKNALTTAEDALYDKQSWYDGTIGALGTVFNVTPNARVKERMQEMNATDVAKLNWLQKANLYITNPLLQAYYEQKGKYEKTEQLLEGTNATVEKHRDALRNIGVLVENLNTKNVSALTPGIDREMNAKDAKEDLAFSLIYNLQASKESPIINQNPLVKQAFSIIDRLASGNISQEEIASFLNNKENRVIADNNSAEDAQRIARERIQKNAQTLQQMTERIQVANELFKESDADAVLYDSKDYQDLRQELAYILSKTDLAQSRANELEQEISGKKLFNNGLLSKISKFASFIGNPQDALLATASTSTTTNEYVAKYGNLENARDNARSRDRIVSVYANELAKAREKFSTDKSKYEEAVKNHFNEEEISRLRSNLSRSEINMKMYESKYTEALAELAQANSSVMSFTNNEVTPVLSEQEILNLNPVDRWTILNPENLKNYSKEQQEVINKTLDNLKAKDQDILSKIKNTSDLVNRVNQNQRAYRLLADRNNREAAFSYINNLRERNDNTKYFVNLYRRVRTVLAGMDKLTTKEQHVEYLKEQLRGENSKYMNEYALREYAQLHPEKESALKDAIDAIHQQRLLSNAIDNVMRTNEQANKAWKSAFSSFVRDKLTVEEFEAAIQDVIDKQKNPSATNVAQQIVNEYYNLASSEKVTKSRKTKKRERLRKERQDAEHKKTILENKRNNTIKKVTDNFGIKVGDTVIDASGSTGTIIDITANPIKEGDEITGFSPEVAVQYNYSDGTASTIRYDDVNNPIANLKKAADVEEAKREVVAKSMDNFHAEKNTSTVDSAQKFNNGEISAQEFLNEVGYNASDVIKNNTATTEQVLNLANRVKSELLENNTEVKVEDTTSKEETKPEEAPEQPVENVTEENNSDVFDENAIVAESVQDVELDDEGATESPTAEEQAKNSGVLVTEVTEDETDQGNILPTSSDVISGNRYVEYSLSELANGVVRQEIPESNTSILGELRTFLDRFGEIKLQEIIDKEFQRILQKNPNVEIRFIKPNYSKLGMANTLDKILLNVIEYTPEVAKYHKPERGGVFEANGRKWLLVGTSGYNSDALENNRAQVDAFNTMQKGIRERSRNYFQQHENEQFYVDSAHTKVRNTTSGRIVNVALGEEKSTLRKVSDLLKSVGKSLSDGMYGIQTKQATESKKFAVTFNAREYQKQGRVYSPRNVEDNAGRTFILIDTPNGNKIPGLIQRTYFNNLDTESALYNIIATELGKLLSKNYAVRSNAISSLRGLLVLTKTGSNILIGKDGTYNNITIRRNGYSDIVFNLNQDVNIIEFMNAIREANFQVNVPLEVLNDTNMLSMYDEAGALMTNVASMEAVGSGYDIYVTNEKGNPIIVTPATVGNPGTGDASFKSGNISFVINNTIYTKQSNGKYVDRNGKEVNPESALGQSLKYNELIKDAAPVFYNRKQYYVLEDNNGKYLVERDSLGNIKVLPKDESNRLMSGIQDVVDENLRKSATLEALEEVDLGEEVTPISQESTDIVQSLEQDLLGEESTPEENTTTVVKIISGGQTGVDTIGLQVGKELGIPTGGTAPKGFARESGIDTEDISSYGLVEITDLEQLDYTKRTGKKDLYTARTELNVRNSDGTVYFSTSADSLGLIATKRAAKEWNKPFIENPTAEQLRNWIQQYNIKVINIAGNRGSKLTNGEEIRNIIKTALTTNSQRLQVRTKEGIVGINNIAKENLQNSDNLDTFEKIFKNHKYTLPLFNILKSKGWGITIKTSNEEIAKILESKGIALTGIKSVEDWMNLIKDCK